MRSNDQIIKRTTPGDAGQTPLENRTAPTIESIARRMEEVRQQLRNVCFESTRALVAAVEAKDPYTRRHSLAVRGFADAIGRRMRLSEATLDGLRAAALLHDVGKIGVPDAILTKPGPLTDEEFDIVKRHPQIAVDILGHLSFLTRERPAILHHHERYDGRGYPAGLAGEEIPIEARVLAVADALDAMLSRRSYKKPYDIGRVREELAAGAGRQFDPAVANMTLKLLDEEPAIFSPKQVHRSELHLADSARTFVPSDSRSNSRNVKGASAPSVRHGAADATL